MDARDDAAIIRWGSAATLVQTVDQFRAFISDPYLFGRIAALHALNDIHAMGAIPHHALLLATLPHGTSSKVAEALFQLLAGARATLDAEGCALVGGHSSEGETMALGLSVSGRLDQPAIGKRGGRPGDCLILTKPLGSGIVFAADMRASVNAPLVEAMLAQMTRSNASAARILRKTGARAMTDVSGFGLIGHLAEMLGDDLGATLNPAPPPYLEGVLALARKGFASSLLPENMRLSARLRDAKAQDAAMLAILFDPQTSGGLLAAVPSEKATATIMELVESGYAASKIGAITGDRSITIGQPVSDRP
jgi:selenide,water dikinase